MGSYNINDDDFYYYYPFLEPVYLLKNHLAHLIVLYSYVIYFTILFSPSLISFTTVPVVPTTVPEVPIAVPAVPSAVPKVPITLSYSFHPLSPRLCYINYYNTNASQHNKMVT